MNYQELGTRILDLVGGEKNVTGLTHCATRLRFNLQDESLAKTNELKETPGVLGVVQSGGQYQVIIGNDVNHVYKPIAQACRLEEKGSAPAPEEKKGLGSRLIDTITGIFTPVLPAITAAGMLKAVLALCSAFGWLNTSSETYQIINFMADAAFYFLPILLANSAAKKFNCNPYIAMLLGGILLHPNFISMVAAAKEAQTTISFLGLPVYSATYSSSVIPIILIVLAQSYIEPFADKISPKAIKFFTKPLITVLVTGLLGLLVLGPIGYILASWIADGINLLNTYVSWLVPLVLGGLFPLLVMTGTHYGIIPIGINNRMTTGFDTIVYPANLCSNMAQGASSFAVTFVLFKDENEGLKAAAGMKTKKETEKEEPKEKEAGSTKASGSILNETSVEIAAPVNGKLVPLAEVNDPTFAQEILGKGFAMIPEDGHFVSPIKGEIVMVFNTEHAIGLRSENGAEILIHVGLDTVNLGGKHYHALVKAGDKVEVGTPILNVELDEVKKAGYDVITPVLVTNINEFPDVLASVPGQVKAGDVAGRAFR